jgi:hypothetical protein
LLVRSFGSLIASLPLLSALLGLMSDRVSTSLSQDTATMSITYTLIRNNHRGGPAAALLGDPPAAPVPGAGDAAGGDPARARETDAGA